MIHAIARNGDFVVCLGDGTITQWAAALPAELQTLQGSQAQRGNVRVGGAA
jgi:UDP-N-acetylmuramate--alanine ligase